MYNIIHFFFFYTNWVELLESRTKPYRCWFGSKFQLAVNHIQTELNLVFGTASKPNLKIIITTVRSSNFYLIFKLH